MSILFDTPSRRYERTYGKPAWSLAAHPNDRSVRKDSSARQARHSDAKATARLHIRG